MSNPKKIHSKRKARSRNKRLFRRSSNTNIIIFAMKAIRRIYNKRIIKEGDFNEKNN